jgi:hypothetical protein
MQKYLDISILENGNLSIEITPEGKEELETIKERNQNYSGIWDDLLESYWTNGSFTPIQPEEIGALTSSPIIGLNIDRDDEGKIIPDASNKFWWFPEYQVIDEFEKLLNDGKVVLSAAD